MLNEILVSIRDFLLKVYPDLSFFIVFMAVGLGAVSSINILFSKGFKFSLRVAVIGQPRAGKTTLITVIFDRVMSGKLAKNATVSGRKTVDRITSHLLTMRSGSSVKSTEDEDIFAYRFQIKRRFLRLIPNQYDVEIADFPGEYSDQLSLDLASRDHSSDNLVSKEFFSWVLQADRYIFAIDVGEWLNDGRDYVLKIDALLKNTVLLLKQELLDESVYERPVVVIFTKSDLIFSKMDFVYDDPAFRKLDSELRKQSGVAVDEIKKDFSPTIRFLKANFRNVRVVHFSSFAAASVYSEECGQIVEFCTP